MPQLIYQDGEHRQNAQLILDDKVILNLSANIDGVSLPRYNAYLANDVTIEEYQENRRAIQEARVQFIRNQGSEEVRMIREYEQRQPEKPEEAEEPNENEDQGESTEE